MYRLVIDVQSGNIYRVVIYIQTGDYVQSGDRYTEW